MTRDVHAGSGPWETLKSRTPLYCWDKAGNLTSQDDSKNACPGGTTHTYDDASEPTGKRRRFDPRRSGNPEVQEAFE